MSTVNTYVGDGVQKNFTFSFPYLSPSHVRVFVNDGMMLNPMHYTMQGNTVYFSDAPGDGDAVVIKRTTSPSDPLVDFTDGSTLKADELDTAYLHNFYLSQEYADSFTKLINDALLAIAGGTGITETEPDAVIAALVNEMLNSAQAASLQQRIHDIDANGEAIITLGEALQVQINTLAQGVAANVYVQATAPVPGVGGVPNPIPEGSRWYDSDDNNKPYIYLEGEWVSIEDPRVGQAAADISVLQTQVGDNAAAIVDESFARSTADSALASTLSLIGAQNAGATAFILDSNTVKIDSDTGETFATRLSTLAAADANNAAAIETIQTVDLANLQARYGVSLNVNGHVTGFLQHNDGQAGSFIILADKFAVVQPGGTPGTPRVPFEIVGDKINLRGDVSISGSLLVNGTVVGSALVAGTIGSTQIGPNAITTDKLNAGAVTALKIEANAVTADKINVTSLSAISANLGAVTAGTIQLPTTGWIRGGQTGYHTGTGFFLGYSTDAYKFSIGNPTAGQYMTWDGATLTIKGDLFVGAYVASDTIRLQALTERTQYGRTWSTQKSFKIDRPGVVRLTFEVMESGAMGGRYNFAAYRIRRGSTTLTTVTFEHGVFTAKSHDVTLTAADQTLSIDIIGGDGWDAGEPWTSTARIRNARVRCDVVLNADGGAVLVN